jgi:hypothetical protein
MNYSRRILNLPADSMPEGEFGEGEGEGVVGAEALGIREKRIARIKEVIPLPVRWVGTIKLCLS